MSGWLTGKRIIVVGDGEVAALVAAAVGVAGAVCDCAVFWEEASEAVRYDALVHCGVIARAHPAAAVELTDWRATHSADLDGRFLAASGFARGCFARKQPGSILFIAAAQGDAARLTANGALDNLVKSLGVEWARDGLRTNAVISRAIGADGSVAAPAQAALGHLAAWLLSDYAVYVNGSVMGIDETAEPAQ